LPLTFEDPVKWITEGRAEIDHDVLQKCGRRLDYQFDITQAT